MPGIDSVSVGIPYETQIKTLDDEIKALNVEKDIVNQSQSLEELLAVQEPASFSNSQMVFDDIMRKKYEELGMNFTPNTQGGGYLLVDNKGSKNQSDNVSMAQYSLGGMTPVGMDYATEVLVKGIR